jgi:hypothetical protein
MLKSIAHYKLGRDLDRAKSPVSLTLVCGQHDPWISGFPGANSPSHSGFPPALAKLAQAFLQKFPQIFIPVRLLSYRGASRPLVKAWSRSH